MAMHDALIFIAGGFTGMIGTFVVIVPYLREIARERRELKKANMRLSGTITHVQRGIRPDEDWLDDAWRADVEARKAQEPRAWEGYEPAEIDPLDAAQHTSRFLFDDIREGGDR